MNLTDLNDLAALWAPSMLRACWQGGLAVGAVWGICRLFPRISPSLRASLWWIACGKIVLSMMFTGPLSLPVLPAEAPPLLASAPEPVVILPSRSAPSSRILEAALIDTTIPPLASTTKPEAAPQTALLSPLTRVYTRPTNPVESLTPISLLFCLWLASVVFLLISACRELRFVRRLADQASHRIAAAEVSDVSRAVGLAQSPPVLISDRADCSLVVGPWNPAVILCRRDVTRLSSSERRALLGHELAHIRRRDLWAGVLPNLARILFFFNPLVWLACREYDLAREAACDAEALRVSGLSPADYGRLLLKLSITPAPVPRYSGTAALSAASPQGLLLRRRLSGLQGVGIRRQKWVSVVALMVTFGALSLNPVRVGAGPVSDAPAMPPLSLSVTDESPAKAVREQADSTKVSVVRSKPATVTPTVRTAADDASLLSMLLPKLLFSPAHSPAQETFPATPTTPRMDSPNRKEEQPMSTFSNERNPKRTSALSAALVTAGIAALLATPATAQETPAIPTPPVPPAAPTVPVRAVVPVVAPIVPAVPIVPIQNSRYQFTLRQGNNYMNHTRDRAVGTAQRELAKAQPGDCLVVDLEGKRYLITDAATLRRVKENYAPVEAIGKEMEVKGKEMEGIGKPMEALGKEMEAIGKKMEAIGKQMEEQGKLMGEAIEQGKSEAERQAIEARMRALQDEMKKPQEEMKAVGLRMKEQGSKMRPLSDQMRVYGDKIRAAVKEAEERMNGILDEAFKNNLAVEQKIS